MVRNGVMGTLLYNTTLLDSVFGVTLDAGSLYTTTRRTFGQVGKAVATRMGSSKGNIGGAGLVAGATWAGARGS